MYCTVRLMFNEYMFCLFISSIRSSGRWWSCLDGSVRSECTNDPEGFAGNRLGTGRAAESGQVEGKVPDEKEYNLVLHIGDFPIGPAT